MEKLRVILGRLAHDGAGRFVAAALGHQIS